MRGKLMFLFLITLTAFVLLVGNIIRINRSSGDEYSRQVLMQQSYSSTTLPFKRGTITDAKGTVLASSSLVYNVILDAKQILEDEDYLEPTLSAVATCFGNDEEELRKYIDENPDSQYYIIDKNVAASAKQQFDEIDQSQEGGVDNIQGIWFEEKYVRSYPNDSLASDVIGFVDGSGNGSYGLEEYYNDTLNGTPGRSYGYVNQDADVERTTIPATDGNNLVLTLDANIQSICEKYLQQFNDTYKDNVRTGNGARNVGVIVMDPNNGDVLAMASYPGFNLNDPYNTDPLVGMTKLDFENNDSPMQNDYLTQEDVDALTDEEKTKYLNALWKNFCISDYYEPGSVAKPFTTGAGLESGAFGPDQTYLCEGSLTVAEGTEPIKCHNTNGDGVLTIGEAIERSCNVALMKEALAMGKETFCHFQNIFGFGLKTNIDLANEAKTDSLIYSPENMGITDLATNSFGQNFDVTMIQVAAAFCSLINGGDFYQPHLVSKITSSSGATVETIQPHIIKKTVSEETSSLIREYCNLVVSGENGTGHTARPAGYMIGGKTGTAETIPRNEGQYVVSFMGYAPADDPQVVIYVVVDRPNAEDQADAKFATRIVRACLTEILPYLNIPMTETLTDEEKAELEQLNESGTLAMSADDIASLDSQGEDTGNTDGTDQTTADGTAAAGTDGTGTAGTNTTGTDGTDTAGDTGTGGTDTSGDNGTGTAGDTAEGALPTTNENGADVPEDGDSGVGVGSLLEETGDSTAGTGDAAADNGEAATGTGTAEDTANAQ